MAILMKPINDEKRQYTLTDFMTLGSDSSCQIPLYGEGVSDRHARIEKKENSFWIKDLRSRQGTYVNDVPVHEAQINPGDLIRFGQDEWMISEDLPTLRDFPMKSRNQIWNSALQELLNVAQTDFPVLILGPSGTGKDIIAQALHSSSTRSAGDFVSVNCSALTETLVESELFGHVKGSFTGAVSDRKGAFEVARGGTLFLDEIGDLPYALQAKLLRALENNEIRPVGSDRTIKTDIRIIAATHQNLQQKIKEGLFRADLYFRLNVMTVTPPSLENRMDDFDDLLYCFAKKLKVRFSFQSIQKLKKHSWPGNIRELKNLVCRASALYKGQLIEEAHIERLIDKTLLPDTPFAQLKAETLPVIKEFEKQMIIQRLAVNRGNQRKASIDLGMPKSTLHDRLKYYNIDLEQFKV
ncbi:MAG: sigma 54-interacting transcriptional regulator [Bdellovibrionales bacterium]|nr:sigma 54-interacting transcriptional regulator [Bdellovibrionales bacterium]